MRSLLVRFNDGVARRAERLLFGRLSRDGTEVRPLDTVNKSIEDVEAGRVPARIAFVP